ncbi:NAD(P)-binding domain-containing protein [soil metagenome]
MQSTKTPTVQSSSQARVRASGNPLSRYMRWLHTRWPAGVVESLPEVREDYSTRIPGVFVVGDLTGIPLLKFSADSGARVVQRIVAELKNDSQPGSEDRGDVLDLVIIGAGVSGMSAALEAKKSNLRFEVLEASEPFSTIINFPKAKPIYTYPTDMVPAGDLQFRAQVKEPLVDEIREQTREIKPKMARAEKIARSGDALEVKLSEQPSLRARNVVVAIGRSGNFRKLDVPGEDLGKVFNRLHDPKEYADKDVLVVGGGDSALETAIAVAECGGRVTLSYRKPEFSRPKPDNIDKLSQLMADPMANVQVERPKSERVTTAMGDYMGAHRKAGSINLMLASKVKAIRENDVTIEDADGKSHELKNDAVFAMIGREAPLDFFRRSGIPIRGDRNAKWWLTLAAFFLICVWVYHWKSQYIWPGNAINVPFPRWLDPDPSSLAKLAKDPSTVLGTLAISASSRSFYYTLAYTTLIVTFGIRRIRRRKTPYVTKQTLSLMLIQLIPLFILPEIVLPLLGHNGFFDSGAMKWIADQLFPIVTYGHGREYWRAYGFILAWPLLVQNVFSDQPMFLWLIISFVQTFVLIPLLIYQFGKGAYCGWICSCGAMAETLGDQHRHKMPHGPLWNRVNMLGQAILLFAFALLFLRIAGWMHFGWAERSFHYLKDQLPLLHYSWLVDLFLAGAIGYGVYFHFSGRVWCRFACPLAALMHIYARFSRFRILANKKKCISCNVCTSVCHQGIDVMNFANKGMPMEDPECVRCSACVQSCPTGVLSFGQVDRKSGKVIKTDPAWLAASPVLMREIHVNGKPQPV